MFRETITYKCTTELRQFSISNGEKADYMLLKVLLFKPSVPTIVLLSFISLIEAEESTISYNL